MRYYTTGHLSPNIQETPEGYLLCPGTAIARTGELEYAPEEVGIEGGADGLVRIHRTEAEVFSPAAMASFEGKPVTLEHPDEDVNPSSWRELAVGIAQNLRRGEGGQADLLLADLLITDARAIEEIRQGLRELSCGYDAHYEETEPGVGLQTGIVGNHIALVDAGRCGPRCKIKDHQNNARNTMWDPKKKPGWWDRLWHNPKVRKALDEAAAEEAAKDAAPAPAAPAQSAAAAESPPPTTDNSDKMDQILVLLNTLIERTGAGTQSAGDKETIIGDEETPANEETPTGDSDDPEKEATPTGDSRGKAADAASRQTADAALVASAKLIAPRLYFRTTDAACTVKRMALRDAAADPGTRRVLDACLRGASLDKADCVTLDAAFVAVSELARTRGNAKTSDALLGARPGAAAGSAAMTPAQLNEQNRKYRDTLKPA